MERLRRIVITSDCGKKLMFAPQSDSIAHNPDLHAVTKNMVHNLGELPRALRSPVSFL
jgi:hypothetical protein